MSAQPGDELLGRVLRGKYTLDRVLGRGGMATVYAATHRNGNRVAVKLLHPMIANEPTVKERFLREGYVANRVDHEGAVRVLDDDIDEEGRIFIVMELLDGDSLGRLLEKRQQPLGLEEVLRFAHEVLATLEAAHEKGIVHRDLKPDNLFLTKDGEVKILDFGIARLRDATGNSSMTQTGQTTGTPAFMPPEQALGRVRDIDGQTDIWALGATLFNLLTNHYVHEAETVAECLIYAGSRPARPIAMLLPNLPPRVAHLVDRALAFEKQNRWVSAREMRSAVEDAYRSTFGRTMPAGGVTHPGGTGVNVSGATAFAGAGSSPGLGPAPAQSFPQSLQERPPSVPGAAGFPPPVGQSAPHAPPGYYAPPPAPGSAPNFSAPHPISTTAGISAGYPMLEEPAGVPTRKPAWGLFAAPPLVLGLGLLGYFGYPLVFPRAPERAQPAAASADAPIVNLPLAAESTAAPSASVLALSPRTPPQPRPSARPAASTRPAVSIATPHGTPVISSPPKAHDKEDLYR